MRIFNNVEVPPSVDLTGSPISGRKRKITPSPTAATPSKKVFPSPVGHQNTQEIPPNLVQKHPLVDSGPPSLTIPPRAIPAPSLAPPLAPSVSFPNMHPTPENFYASEVATFSEKDFTDKNQANQERNFLRTETSL